MKKLLLKILFLLVLSTLLSTTSAQVDFSFSGYVVDMPVYTFSSGNAPAFFLQKNQFINLTRLRLKPQIFLGSDTRINIEYEVDALVADNVNSIELNQVARNRQLINLKWEISSGNRHLVNHYIDRFYLRKGFDWGNVIIGRQRISWGTGRIWNPTDLFNPINPANFSKIEKDGADAVSLTYYLGNFTDLNIVYNPQDKFKENNAAFRFRTNFETYDLSIIGGYFDRRYIAGFDFAGNLWVAGIRGEGIISMDKNDLSKNYSKFVFGIDNQFTSKLYGLVEYQYNGRGITDKYSYDLQGLANGEIINLNKNYLFLSSAYQITPLFAGTISNNINLNDGSGFVSISGDYSMTGNSTFTLGGFFTYGQEYTEYKYYQNSIYIQAELYF
ncbi:MAG TPA: hypothetical protein VKA26_10720 [Ignavibacteriaceae bacterium]|nr:hypothetical protein [Ignavibacteriaceae bacterium]